MLWSRGEAHGEEQRVGEGLRLSNPVVPASDLGPGNEPCRRFGKWEGKWIMIQECNYSIFLSFLPPFLLWFGNMGLFPFFPITLFLLRVGLTCDC